MVEADNLDVGITALDTDGDPLTLILSGEPVFAALVDHRDGGNQPHPVGFSEGVWKLGVRSVDPAPWRRLSFGECQSGIGCGDVRWKTQPSPGVCGRNC